MASGEKEIAVPISAGREEQSFGADSSEQRISELSGALDVVKEKFTTYRKNIKIQIWFWGCICILIIVSCIYLSYCLLNESFPDKWSWQIGYVSAIRITIAGGILSLASFCFKTFKSYMYLNEQNSHCITVVESMANLVGAAKDEQQRSLIYNKLIDIIIKFGYPLNKSDEFKGVPASSFEALKKFFEK